jgi:hypothetical protein
MTSRFVSILAGSLFVLAPELARACAVCGAGADEDASRIAYLVTTIVLSALPLAMLGGFLLWLRARARRAQRS